MPPTKRKNSRNQPHEVRRNSQKTASSSASPTSGSGTAHTGRTHPSISVSPTGSVGMNVTQPPSVVARLRVTPESSMYSATTGRRIASVVGVVANGTRNAEDILEVSMRGADDSWYLSATKGEAEEGKKYALDKYVRKTLFPRWIFLPGVSN